MKVYTKVVWDIESGTVLEADSFEYTGEAALAKGATSEEKSLDAQQAALAQQEAQFYSTLQSTFQQQFAQQTAILNTLQSVWGPIFQAGPSQEGFSQQEKSALTTQAMEGTSSEYQKALQATNDAIAARGGDSFLPSGADAQVRANVATAAAQNQSQENLNIQQADYERGYQNFLAASNALSGVSTQYNPLGYAGTANQGGGTAAGGFNDAFQSASTIQQQDQAASPIGAISGAIGGAAGAVLGIPPPK